MEKCYIGDAVYARVEDERLVLTTEDGIQATNMIVLEPEVWARLLLYMGRALKREPRGPWTS